MAALRRPHPMELLFFLLSRLLSCTVCLLTMRIFKFGNVFIEALNIYLRDNPGNYSFDESQPFSKANPSVTPEFGNLVIPTSSGQGLRVPLINFGVEVQF